MKVIVAGATGVAGGEAVKHCLEDSRVTKVVILTRKAISGDIGGHPKTEVIIHQDFQQYPDELMKRLEGSGACIWAIGGPMESFNNDKELARKVGVEFTLAAATAMCNRIADKAPNDSKFRFVFCSGQYASWDQTKPLYFYADTRRLKGEVEKGLCDLADANPGKFEARILRPGGFITPNASSLEKFVGGLYGAIKTSQLGKCLVQVACEGSKDRITENAELLKM